MKVVRLILIPLLLATMVTAVMFVLSSRPQAPAAAPEAKVQVVVAAKAIPAHTVLQAGDLALAQVPATLMGHGEFTRVDAAAGMITTQEIVQGQIILGGQVVEAAKGTMTYRIPADLRAVTIRVDEYSGVAGYPNPGDHVDVVLVMLPKDKTAGYVRLLAQDLLVLAQGPNNDSAKGDKTQSVPGGNKLTSYTLAVTPEQAQLLTLGQQEGTLALALRPVPNPGQVPAPVIPDARLGQ